jgi:glutaredoxin|tara:strand:+ start:11159 stop:11446 length:288 start_codon:yes stop_codon:yes gene_type:complete
MKYYKIICWSECPYCLQAKMVMIDRSEEFEYCSVNHSPLLLDHYKSIYKHETVPMIVEIDTLTGQERFIGGYTNLIEYFKKQPVAKQVCDIDGKG